MNIYDKILKQFKTGAFKNVTEREICDRLHLKPSERKAVHRMLLDMVDEGELVKDKWGCFRSLAQANAVTGTVHANARGFAFLIPDKDDSAPDQKDFFLPHRSLHGALNKDRVLCVRVPNTEDEVEVVKILEHGNTRVVGTFDRDRHAGYVLPDDSRLDTNIYIPLGLTKNAKPGDKVVAEVTSFPHGKMPGGCIIEIMGEQGDFYVEELSIIRSHDLYEEFSSVVEREAEEVSKQPVVLDGRRDLRDLFTITIDGEDTRDIDDAVSLSYEDGEYRLGVHIADVSHYVKPLSELDKEAYARGTSVYFPDRVLPMLPKSLSNGACSLNEGEEKYALSCLMRFDKNGNRLGCELCQSVILSNHRTTYHLINDIYEGKHEAVSAYPDLVELVHNMAELCLIFERKRKAQGSVNLDVKEAHIYVDENDELCIPDYERLLSHRMIEQFMVSANEAVATVLEEKGLPCLYRIHEKPVAEKAGTFASFLRDLGIPCKFNSADVSPKDFARVLDGLDDHPFASVVNRVMLRSMQKARYSEKNVGHFGLASECYCHFTSPIRRYPDLFVHRIIHEMLDGNEEFAKARFGEFAKKAAIDTSECERRADEAERDVDDLYKVVYMSERMGQEFDAVVSGVTAFGVFAELPNTVEGLIRLETLPQDSYEFVEEKFLLKGQKHRYRLGDPIRIVMAGCDWVNMRPEFTVAKTQFEG